jgi:hypothetical protein
MTDKAASATNDAKISSEPYCFEAMAGFSARVSDDCVNGLGSVWTDSAVKETQINVCY